MAVYSHSRLSTYEQCPRKYRFRYVEKFDIGDRQSVEAYRGGVVHEALRRLYELVMSGNVWPEEKLLAYYEETWEEDRPSEIFIKDEELTEEHFRVKGREMLSDYYRTYHPFDQEKTVGLERSITVNLDPDGKYRAQGYIDRLAVSNDGVMQIHDYKTARSIVRQQNLDEDRQLALYQLGVQQMWPDREGFELVWHYLAVPEKRTSRRTNKDIAALVDETIRLIREIEQATEIGEFPTHESRLCNWCEYMSFCPAKIHPLQVEGSGEEELKADEVVKLVDRLIGLRKVITDLSNESEEIKHRLAGYAKEKDLTALAGTAQKVNIRFGQHFKPKFALLAEGKEDEKKRFVEFLIRTGMIDQVFSYNAMSFDSFIKKAKFSPEFKDELFSLIRSVDAKPIVMFPRRTRDA